MSDTKWRKEFILKTVEDEKVEVIWHWFVDVEGHLKCFAITPSELPRSLEDGMAFDGSSISGFSAIEESDLVARPDVTTFALMPSGPDQPHAARFFCDIQYPNGEPYDRDPRYVLRRVVEMARAKGLESYMGPEIEFFLFKGMKDPTPLDVGGYFTAPPVDFGDRIRTDIINKLHELGIPVEYHHHEVADSQHEIDLRYDKVLKIADAAVTYKYLAKLVAHNHGAYATFMPKPLFGINGSGMHVHQSLFHEDRNAFADLGAEYSLSTMAKQYIAGLLKYAEECCTFWSPTVNSYKRLVPGFEAPTYIAWSQSNRSALIRVPAVVPGKEKSVRCELRCPDPSANPYLAFAVMLAAGLKGIEEGLELEPPQVENLYHLTELERQKRQIRSLPANLHEALHHTRKSEFLHELLGERLFNNFLELKYNEFNEYRVRVTPWEMERYFAVL